MVGSADGAGLGSREMDLVEFSPTREQYTYTFGGVAPVMKIRPGMALRVWSDDAFGGVLRSVDDLSGEKVDLRYVNPQTGPFFVEGAEPGDTLVLHFVSMEPARDWGASAAIPFFGGMTSTDRVATLQDPLPDTTPAAICVRRRIPNGGIATLATTRASTMAPAMACRTDVETVATIEAPMIVPGTRPAMIHPTPTRSSACLSCRAMPIEIGRPRTITVTGSALGITNASTGTLTRFIPNPIDPCKVAPTAVAAAAHSTAAKVTSTRDTS